VTEQPDLSFVPTKTLIVELLSRTTFLGVVIGWAAEWRINNPNKQAEFWFGKSAAVRDMDAAAGMMEMILKLYREDGGRFVEKMP